LSLRSTPFGISTDIERTAETSRLLA